MVRLAAAEGNAAAQNNLGVAHVRGQGVPQNDTEAVRWFRLAADQGLADAQFDLGVLYQEGEGIPQDLVAAHMWFSLAAAQLSAAGRFTYAQARDVVAEEMPPEQIAEAQRLAREWQPTQPSR